jgi:TonB family protein
MVTEATGPSPVAGGVERRSMLAGAVSLGAHGLALLVIFVVAGRHIAATPRLVELLPIEITEAPPPPPPSPPPGPGGQQRGTTNTSDGTLGRHGHDAPPPSKSRAPVKADPFADAVMSYETSTGPDPGNEAGTTGLGFGAGLAGAGNGGGDGFTQFGLGDVPPAPPPPAASRARPPRPKYTYDNWDFRAQGRFAGAIVQVELTVDPSGNVRDVSVLRSVDNDFDHHAIDLARQFKFYPALDEDGRPTWGRHRWEFVIKSAIARDFHFQSHL